MIPGMCDTPVILNLHLRLWDSYIANWMSGRRLQRKTEERLRLPT